MTKRPFLFWLGFALLVGFAGVAILAPLLAPYDPLQPLALPLSAPSQDHLLGTNDLGQDILSQMVYGTRSTLIVAISVTAISTALSWIVGLAAGFIPRLEGLLMGLTDLLLALPELPLILLVLTLIDATRITLILVLGLLSWPVFARLVRSIVIGVRASPYVEASKALGASGARIMARHLLPATLDVLPAKLVLTVRYAVFAESTLAFLGVGGSDTVSLGSMLKIAFSDPLLFSRPVWPWLVLSPAIAIAALILATVWAGSGLSGNRMRKHGQNW
ncbi:MAG: ABC transporter permease [Thermomicrobiales bacterium]